MDLYATLQAVNTMQPLVKDPKVTAEELLDELNHPTAYTTPGSGPGDPHRCDVLHELGQKVMRVLRDAEHKAEQLAPRAQRLAQLQEQWGVPPAQQPPPPAPAGKEQGTAAAADFLRRNTRLVQQAEVRRTAGHRLHARAVGSCRRTGGPRAKLGQLHQACGLPGQLHRLCAPAAQPVGRAVGGGSTAPKTSPAHSSKKCACCCMSHTKPSSTAWRNQSNQDIAAASWPTFREAALGEALVPFDQRVQAAMQTIP